MGGGLVLGYLSQPKARAPPELPPPVLTSISAAFRALWGFVLCVAKMCIAASKPTVAA